MLPSSWKRDIASGLVILVPLIVTAYVVAVIYRTIASIPYVDSVLTNQDPIVQVAITLVLFALLVLSIGYLMRTTLGDLLEAALDNIMNQLPGLRVVYNASKMAVETAVSGPEDLQTPVKIETWNGMRMTAFKTGKTTPDGRDVLFLPTAPNITTGFVVEVEPDQYEEVNESVEDALTRILSAGFGENQNTGIAIDVTEGGPVARADEKETTDD
ncbi:DUF502 domain-containing protein [Natronomonas marina]|jgi:uncharacterized membrane protein|uniref:DUF502 domain-containing protein n=1 Tax=Natronomonas marina TaxID=2961939 RepID=UPI0020C9FA30|nr:DUF502 domain-containing protein [Natronomonas marina]